MISASRGGAIITALAIWSLPLSAQEIPTRASGLADGRIAAEDGSIASAFILGLAGGVPIGVSGAHFSSQERSEASATPAIVGAGMLLGAGVLIHLGTNAPRRPLTEPGGPNIDAYTAGFREGYESRLRSRRRNALALGGLVGAGVGVVTWSLLRRATDRY